MVGALDSRQKGEQTQAAVYCQAAGLARWSLQSLQTDLLSCWSIHMTYQLSSGLEGVARSVE